MSRRVSTMVQQTMCLHGLLHRIQPAVRYWQFSKQVRDYATHTGSCQCIHSWFSTASILSHSGKFSLDFHLIPKRKFHFSSSVDTEGNLHPVGKHSGKLKADASHVENTVEPLLSLGFTQVQVKKLLDLSSRTAAQVPLKAHPVLCLLYSLGLRPGGILKVLEKCPELGRIKDHQLQSRIDNLRKHGLDEERLQWVLVHHPQILNRSAKQVNNTVRFFKEKCIFTVQQITEILQTSPNVLFENFEELEYKFQFAYFRMGLKQAAIVKSGIFQTSLEELKQRLIFLERLGHYQTPDKKGQTLIINPKPKDIFTTTEDYFLAKVAMSSWEEFDTFKKLLKREEMEERELGHQEDSGTSEELSDSEEDEEFFPGN
ncbi:transcription termination factor 4, mitochondrial [Mobula hypostoma]|uniref:transcription termination factor 4, mitochondrial n=1 Tax=Mobula hypostoma TaxID=723540 RepID=UPI002FC2B282